MRCRPMFPFSLAVLAAPLFFVLGCDGSPHPHKSSVASGAAGPAGASAAAGPGGASGADFSAAATSEEELPQRGRNPEYGQMLYGNTCLACHGTRGQGMPNQGVDLRTSKFIADS